MARKHEDACFIRALGWFFGSIGDVVCAWPWTLILLSSALCGFGTLKIPLSPLSNRLSDFTPLDSPSYKEFAAYANFYADGSTPNTVYAFVTAKNGGSMLSVKKMTAAIDVLDTISTRFKMETSGGPLAFEQFCRSFCLMNEPVRTFYNGLRMLEELGPSAPNESSITAADVSYPDMSVLGVRLHLDPSLFGVEIAVERDGEIHVVSPNDAPELNQGKQLHNNLRAFKLLVLNFKSEIDGAIPQRAVDAWEAHIVEYFTKEYHSDEITVRIFTDSFLTSEVVRSGLQLIPFLAIGFVIMVVFSAATFVLSAMALGQMSYDKIFLAWMASTCPFMASGAGLGLMFWCGVRFGTILCVTPFLILAIGVDDAYLMVNAWQQITSARRKKDFRLPDANEELRVRMREMLIETGPSIAITTITNVAAFMISAMNGSPEVQLFSVGNAVCVLMAFVFQMSIYGSCMTLTGRREIVREYAALEQEQELKYSEAKLSTASSLPSADSSIAWIMAKKEAGRSALKSLLHSYCWLLTRRPVAIVVMALMGVYLVVCTLGAARIKPQLRPERLFLGDSSFVKLFDDRQEHIIPHYSVAWIYVQHPGDLWEAGRRAEVENMVRDFESLPNSVGRYTTKFFLREFETFAAENPDLLNSDTEAFEFDESGNAMPGKEDSSHYNQLQNFLSWPENSYWKGFVQFEDERNFTGTEPKIVRFMLTTAFQGEELKDWSNRVTLLKQWRALADKYASLNVSVYQEDSKFLDVIETMVPQAVQSAALTIVCMFLVTLLFIPQPLVLCTATFTIFSTSLGVFGLMSWAGSELDPILACSTIMSIGFAVDIPAHIAYHYHQTGAHVSSVVDRLEHTISRVGFPIMQASISTILCVSSLFFVKLHMSTIFASTLLLVVIIGTIQGMIVMPVIFGLSDIFSRKKEIAITPKISETASEQTLASCTSTTTILAIS